MRVLCFISTLGSGGSERVMTWLSQGLARRGHEVTLASFDDGHEPPFYGAPEGVHLRYLDILTQSASRLRALSATRWRVSQLRCAIFDVAPHVVLSFGDRTNVLTLAAALRSDHHVVVSERVDPRTVNIGRAYSWARRVLYRRCQRLVVQADDIRACFGRGLQGRIRVIPNPVMAEVEGPAEAKVPGRKTLLAVGRLVPQKGFDLLIEAFARVAPSFPEWDVSILGDGPSLQSLTELAERRQVAQRVRFLGRQRYPLRYYRAADAFALPSRFEGFPNTLVEAMASGLPALATACTGAVSNIVEGGASGILIPPNSVPALTRGLTTLLGDAHRRARLAEAGRRVIVRYGSERVLDQWESVLAEAAQ